jgi:hypothetical protein
MKNSYSRTATKAVVQGVCESRDALDDCRLVASLQAKLGTNNSLLNSAMARRCEALSITFNGSDKYNVKLGQN